MKMTFMTDMKNVEQLIHGLLLFSCQVEPNSFATPRTIACQAPLSTGFARQEYWSVLPFPSPGDLPKPGLKPLSPALTGRFFTTKFTGQKNRNRCFSRTPLLFHIPADVHNLISGFSAFAKTSLNIWKFTVHVLLKPGLENFEHYFTSM